MAKVGPIHFEFRVVIQVQQFMNDGILHVFFVEESILAKQNFSQLGAKAARPLFVAGVASQIGGVNGDSVTREVLGHKSYSRT